MIKDKKIYTVLLFLFVYVLASGEIKAYANSFTANTNQLEHWGMERVGVNGTTLSGKGVKVAVIDTGIDLYHPDLHVSGGVSFVDYTTSFHDDHGHGTHVAGIIAAKNNGYGIVGIAPNVELYAVKALDSKREGPIDNVVKGINWAIDHGMDIIHLSWSTWEDNPALKEAVSRAYRSGLLIVGSAGNTGTADGTGQTVRYPAKYEEVIAVAALNQSNNRASFSATGPEIEVAAPGVDIYSTNTGSTYAQSSGTSEAAPHVTGVLALLKEAYPATYSNVDIRNMMQAQAVDLGTPGKDDFYGYGLVQAPVHQDVNTRYPETLATKLTLLGTESTYWSPSFHARSGDALGAQPIMTVSEQNNGWYFIQTWVGDRWISPVNVKYDYKRIIILTENKYLYASPNGRAISSISPQILAVHEKRGNWYKIDSWLGPVWMKM